jgi:N6-adenosine-specific RNA methylase IME4
VINLQPDMFPDVRGEPPDWPFKGLPRNSFAVIAADPPWHFKTWSETNQDRAISRHYDLMTLDDIGRLPVADLAAPDCVLLLWCVNPMLPQAIATMESWGFQYKSVGFCWAKTTRRTAWSWAPNYHMGLGYWTRANIELCLLGVRGKPKRVDRGVRQLIVAPLREHSRKPEEFYESTERLAAGPYLELFSRTERAGWSTWGNEAGKFNEVAA